MHPCQGDLAARNLYIKRAPLWIHLMVSLIFKKKKITSLARMMKIGMKMRYPLLLAHNRHMCERNKANFVPVLEKMYFFIMIECIVWLWYTYLDFFVQKKRLHVGTQKCRKYKNLWQSVAWYYFAIICKKNLMRFLPCSHKCNVSQTS